jgi:hypothetical protein
MSTQSDAPEPVTKRRQWHFAGTIYIDETPDPAYDVQAADEMADELYALVGDALRDEPRLRDLNVEDVSIEGD